MGTSLNFRKEVSMTTFQPCVVVSYPALGENNEIRFNLELEQDTKVCYKSEYGSKPIPVFLVSEDASGVLSYFQYIEHALGRIPEDTQAFMVPKELMQLQPEDMFDHNRFVTLMYHGSMLDTPELRSVIDEAIRYGKENQKIMMPWIIALVARASLCDGVSVKEAYDEITG